MKRWLLPATVLLVLCARAAPAFQAGTLRIVWIDVEGGAATLVVTPAGETLLIDAGWPGARDAERIAQAARAEGASRIDHLLITHFHTDHWGGVADLARSLPIGRFYDRGLPDELPEDVKPQHERAYRETVGDRRTVLQAGDTIQLAGVQIRVLCADGTTAGEPAGAPQTRPCTEHPAKPDDESDNARSLGFLLTSGDFEFLNLGDLTWNVEHKLVCPQNLVGTVDVYQTSHHGHEESNNRALLEAVRPTVTVVNNGARKGCSASTFRCLDRLSSIEDIFQLHRNVTTGPADNATPEFVANDEESCQGQSIRLMLDPSGETYTVEIPSKQKSQTYPVKRG